MTSNTYLDHCRQVCEGCGKGLPFAEREYWKSDTQPRHKLWNPHGPVLTYIDCTAPTESQYIEELVEEIARLTEDRDDGINYIVKIDAALDAAQVPDSAPNDKRSSFVLLADNRVTWLATERESLKAQVEQLTKELANWRHPDRWKQLSEQQQQEIEALLEWIAKERNEPNLRFLLRHPMRLQAIRAAMEGK